MLSPLFATEPTSESEEEEEQESAEQSGDEGGESEEQSGEDDEEFKSRERESGVEYTIEKIIAGPRTIHGIVQFKVKWEDWPLEKATWEPKAEVRGPALYKYLGWETPDDIDCNTPHPLPPQVYTPHARGVHLWR